nr:uncharacterized protein LOC128683101 [Plodia interpunctella]
MPRELREPVIIQKIPEVDACCICIPLKIAVLMISVYTACLGLIAQLNYTDIKYEGLCEFNPPSACELINLMYFLKYFNAFQGNLVFGASLACFVGIYINNSIAVSVYLYVMAVRTVLIVVQCLILVLFGNTVSNCNLRLNQTVLCISSTVLSCVCNIYILIIAKSYRSKISLKSAVGVETEGELTPSQSPELENDP